MTLSNHRALSITQVIIDRHHLSFACLGFVLSLPGSDLLGSNLMNAALQINERDTVARLLHRVSKAGRYPIGPLLTPKPLPRPRHSEAEAAEGLAPPSSPTLEGEEA
jgi:hypothetical protein